MPNWCEGNLRLRGTGDAILEFVKNEFEVVGHKRGGGLLCQSTCAPEIVYECSAVDVRVPEQAKDWIFLDMYIKNTRRNFVGVKGFNFFFDEDELKDVHTVCIDDFRAAWGVDVAPYMEKAKKYGIDIKIIGFECGMQFAQYIEIVNGELIKNQEITFDDWNWECIMPNMGG